MFWRRLVLFCALASCRLSRNLEAYIVLALARNLGLAVDDDVLQGGRQHAEGVLYLLVHFVINRLPDVLLQDVHFAQLLLLIRVVDVVVRSQAFHVDFFCLEYFYAGGCTTPPCFSC